MDEVSGSGSAELLRDDSLAITFAYHLGDEVVLKADCDFFSNLLAEHFVWAHDVEDCTPDTRIASLGLAARVAGELFGRGCLVWSSAASATWS